jgi:tripartite-type tricarboxylate transporter receptor subunit TctC
MSATTCAARASLALLTFVSVASLPLLAQEKFPSRPIEIIMPVPPGGGTDLAVRQLIDLVEPTLGQKLVPVNKPGEARGANAEGTGSIEFRKLIDSENKAMGEIATSLGLAKK